MGPLQDKIGFSKMYTGILAVELLVCSLITTIVTTNTMLYFIFVFFAELRS